MKGKTTKKWKPKHRWIESITINLKGGKTKYKYFTPKTPEEEKRLEAEFDEKMQRVLEIVFPNGIKEKEIEKLEKENDELVKKLFSIK
jgi:hypothetical protein